MPNRDQSSLGQLSVSHSTNFLRHFSAVRSFAESGMALRRPRHDAFGPSPLSETHRVAVEKLCKGGRVKAISWLPSKIG